MLSLNANSIQIQVVQSKSGRVYRSSLNAGHLLREMVASADSTVLRSKYGNFINNAAGHF